MRSGVQKIAFTGSVRTGKLVMKAAADTLTPVLLELGGKDPMVVCDDADLERAANGAVWGAFMNAGQTCMRPSTTASSTWSSTRPGPCARASTAPTTSAR